MKAQELRAKSFYDDLRGHTLQFISSVIVDIGDKVEIFKFVCMQTGEILYYTYSDVKYFEEVS